MVKYYSNLNELFTILIYFRIYFISVMEKLNYSSLQCHKILQKCSMLICCSKKYFLLLSMLTHYHSKVYNSKEIDTCIQTKEISDSIQKFKLYFN